MRSLPRILSHLAHVTIGIGAWLLGARGILLAIIVAVAGGIVFTVSDLLDPNEPKPAARRVRWLFTSNLLFSAIMGVLFVVVLGR